jgi:hypothetical protein
MINKSKFWPLDYDPEGEIYESLSWDLPGLRPKDKVTPSKRRRGLRRLPHRSKAL